MDEINDQLYEDDTPKFDEEYDDFDFDSSQEINNIQLGSNPLKNDQNLAEYYKSSNSYMPNFDNIQIHDVNIIETTPKKRVPLNLAPKSIITNNQIDEDEDSDIITTKYSSQYNSWGYVKVQNQKSIISIIVKKTRGEIEDKIIKRAESIYCSLDPTILRHRRQMYRIFYCLYQAYQEFEIDVDIYKLGLYFDMKKSDIQKSFSMCSPAQTNYNAPRRNNSPKIFLSTFFEKIDLNTNLKSEIEQITDFIFQQDPKFNEEHPRTIAAGIFKYFIMNKGIRIEDQKLMEITGRSMVTIDNIVRRIIIIHNEHTNNIRN